jgi:hypothetical protein
MQQVNEKRQIYITQLALPERFTCLEVTKLRVFQEPTSITKNCRPLFRELTQGDWFLLVTH